MHLLTAWLTGDSDYLGLTFKLVVEHVHGIALATTGRRHRYARTSLEILVRLAKGATFLLVDAAWINKLLERAAAEKMNDDVFVLFLRLRALRKEEDGAADAEFEDCIHVQGHEADPQSLGRTVTSSAQTPEYALLNAISKNVKACIDDDEGLRWQDEAVYGGLIAIRDIRQLEAYFPDATFLKTLAEAMEKNKPFSVRKAAYDVVQAAQDGWLRSVDLRQTLEDHDFPKQLHSVVITTCRSDHQLSFLKMMEILSEDRGWHSYLRGAMHIWLDFRNATPDQAIRILLRVGEIWPPEDGQNLPIDNLIVKIVEDEWARVPGRQATDLSVDLLEPLAEVTAQLKELMFSENDRRAVLAMVERVIPCLEMRRAGGYEGPGEDICGVVNNLLSVLRASTTSTSRRPSYWQTT